MNLKLTILSAVFGGLALSWAISAFIARDYSVRNREIFTEMAYSETAKSQGKSDVLPGGLVQQSPPEGTRFRGQYSHLAPIVPLDKLSADDLAKVRAHNNPYAGAGVERLAALEAQGATLYVNNCQSCHGINGAAGAPVAAFGIGATNLPANLGKYTDGELFHIIGYGVRTMPAHEDHVRADERWKLILHLRKLAGAKP